MLDNSMIILWTIAYSCILWNAIKYRNEANMMMPFLACIINFAWEICAVHLSRGFWGHVIWLVLDIGIYIFNIDVIRKKTNNPRKYVTLYLLITAFFLLVGFWVFRYTYGIMYSSFIVNLSVSLIFVLYVKSVSSRVKLTVAVTKMLGTFCATLHYGRGSLFVTITGTAILLLDLFYLACCFEEKGAKKRKKERNVYEFNGMVT